MRHTRLPVYTVSGTKKTLSAPHEAKNILVVGKYSRCVCAYLEFVRAGDMEANSLQVLGV